jgi:glycosyltransferase involved in cell wall biosynthesis
LDLSVLIPALDERDNLARFLPEVRAVLEPLEVTFEILVVTVRADNQTTSAALKSGARF